MRAWFESLNPARPLDRHGKRLAWVVAASFVVFFAYTLYGTAFHYPRKGDLDVYLRAAWAAREGASIYQITDPHGWHYLYPPLLATLMIPLADPPDDALEESKADTCPIGCGSPSGVGSASLAFSPRFRSWAWLALALPAAPRHFEDSPGRSGTGRIPAGYLPYWLSVTIWYWLGIACVLASVQIVASALEDTGAARGSPPPAIYSQGWWALRLLPLLVTLCFAGDGLGRGQSTPILLLCLAGTGAAVLRGHRLRAGLWLGSAAIIKLFPAYLLIYPLWRRDGRFLVGAAITITVGLLLPVAIMGPAASLRAYQEFVGDRLLGEVQGHGDPAVAEELHGTNSRIQSFEYILYDIAHPNRGTRAPIPPDEYFLAHIALSAVLTGAALWAMRRRGDALAEFLFFAGLVQLVVPILPVSRPHYYVFGILVLAGLYAAEWPRRRGLWSGWPVAIAAIAYALASILDGIDQPLALEFGLATFAGLALGVIALLTARRRAAAARTDLFLPLEGKIRSG